LRQIATIPLLVTRSRFGKKRDRKTTTRSLSISEQVVADAGERQLSAEDYVRARDAIVSLNLNGANRALAEIWLARWHNGEPPKMRSFRAVIGLEYKPAVMLCQITQGQSLHCISGGAIMRVALGYDISNRDLLALTPVGERDMRLDYWWNVVEGAVSVTYRQFTSVEGHSGLAQGIGLPFSDRKVDGSRYFIMHTNWRPVGTDWIEGNVRVNIHSPPQRQTISFKHPDEVLI
jgi:hypothetical protein